MNRQQYVLIGLMGLVLLVSTPSYSFQDDHDNKKPPAVRATVYDLKSQWSDKKNPAGPWTYQQNSAALPFVADWTPLSIFDGGYNPPTPQPAWAPSTVPGDFLPAWFKAAGTPVNNSLNWHKGDIVVHTTDSANGAGQGPANVLFTNPISGLAIIAGDVWSARTSLGRANNWSLLVNGIEKASGLLTEANGLENPEAFYVSGIPLDPNDTVELLFEKASEFGDYVGANLTIVVTPVFAGTPGKPNCHGQSVSALARQYGGLNAAAAALGYPSVQALQEAIEEYCEG